MQIRTLQLSEDGASRIDDEITLTRQGPGQITLNDQPVLAIRSLDRCTLAFELLGETRYLASDEYWSAMTGKRTVDARQAGCLLGHLDSLAIAAHHVLTAFADQSDLSPEAQAALARIRTVLNELATPSKV